MFYFEPKSNVLINSDTTEVTVTICVIADVKTFN